MVVHPPLVPAASAARVLVTGTLSDAHTWNLIFLQKYIAEAGHEVVNLGPCVPESLLVESCLRLRPDLIVMSSVNGHGVPDGLRAIAAIRAVPVLTSLPVIIGGKLTTTGALSTAQLGQLAAAGFDAVFNDTALAPFRILLTGAAGSLDGIRRIATSA
jgi:methylmalonyl-CoA mutase cobalamin-binding subunit